MIYKIKTHPNSSENKIIKNRDILEIYVKEKAENNKANLAVLRLLSRHFKGKKIKLRGLSCKHKIAEVKEGKCL